MAAQLAADGVGNARLARLGGDDVVLALPELLADGMNRRQIQHIEAQVGDPRQEVDLILKRTVAVGFGGRRAREHRVPGAKSGPLAIDVQR